MNNFDKGIFYENLACDLLRSKNLDVIGTRIKSTFGEIDVLARFNQNFYITEIKFRKNLENAAFSISKKQFQRSIATFFVYTSQQKLTFEKYFYIAILFSANKYKIVNVDSFEVDFSF